MPDVVMPRLSDSMEEGTILRWLVEDGATVARGDEIAEIETDKANMTYEADAAGVFERRRGRGRHAADRRADRADRRTGRLRPSQTAGGRVLTTGRAHADAAADVVLIATRPIGEPDAERIRSALDARCGRALRGAGRDAATTAASRRRRSRGGWRASGAWTSRA